MTHQGMDTKGNSSLGQTDDVEGFENLFAHLMDGVFIVDKDGNPCCQNPAASEILREFPASSLFRKDFPWEEKSGKSVQLSHTLQDGRILFFEMDIAPIKWKKEHAYLAVLRNISAEKENEINLQSDLDQAETRTAELEVMRFVADQLNQAAMVEDTLQSGLEMIQALTTAAAVWAILVDEKGKSHLVVVDNQEKGMRAERGEINLPSNCTCVQKLLNGELLEPLYVQNCEWMPYIFSAVQKPYRHISVPLKSAGKNLGLLNLAIVEEGQMGLKDLTLVQNLANQLSQAIERARLFSNNKQALRQNEVLNSATRTINSALDLSSVLQNVMRLASELTSSAAGSLALLTPEDQILNFPFTIGLPAEMIQPMRRSANLFWEVMESGKPKLINDYGAPLESILGFLIPGLHSLLMVPIISREKPLGVISLYNMDPDKNFTDFDLSLIESLGRQAGLAIQNAQLFFEVQQLTTVDTLTGLQNTHSFTTQAMKEVERAWRYGRPASIVMVDLDNLTGINQKYGQEVGDQALQTLAKSCLQFLRRVDILGRYENAEILLLLPETDLVTAFEVADRLREKISTTTLQIGEISISITASMGISGIEAKDRIDLQTLLDQAESALFNAKSQGRNKVCVWKME